MAAEPVPYQTVGFYFKVTFNFKGLKNEPVDARFQSVSGLDVRLDTEEIKEGGENRFIHIVPTRRRYADLILKRGLISPSVSGVLTDWCFKAFEEMIVVPIDIDVSLLNEKEEPLMTWQIQHARPKSWKIGELNAERSEVLIETIELSYNSFSFKSAAGKAPNKFETLGYKTPNSG
jgi:phage tail-like protein